MIDDISPLLHNKELDTIDLRLNNIEHVPADFPLELRKLSNFLVHDGTAKDVKRGDAPTVTPVSRKPGVLDPVVSIGKNAVKNERQEESSSSKPCVGNEQQYFCFVCGQRPFSWNQLSEHLRNSHWTYLEGKNEPIDEFSMIHFNDDSNVQTVINPGQSIKAVEHYICFLCISSPIASKNYRKHLTKKHDTQCTETTKYKYGGKVFKLDKYFVCPKCYAKTTNPKTCRDHNSTCFGIPQRCTEDFNQPRPNKLK